MFPQKHSKQTVFVKSFGIGKMEWFMEGTNECSVEDKCHAASTPQPSFTCSESTMETSEQ